MGYYDRYDSWPKYVSVGERRQKAAEHVAKQTKKGSAFNPVVIEGRTIARTFWGKAWCDNLESYSDFSNRLPRGRTYVRNGSVIDLQVTNGLVNAQVMGSSLYKVKIEIKPMLDPKWKTLVKACTGKIDSLIELLQGKFSKAVMTTITQKEVGLFPTPKEISMKCSCPDFAGMCKHIAAVLYGVGAVLDNKPEWLFKLRHVDHGDLIANAAECDAALQNTKDDNAVKDDELSELFGIELDTKINSKAKQPVCAVPVKKKSPLKRAKSVKKAASKQKALKDPLKPKVQKRRIIPTSKRQGN